MIEEVTLLPIEDRIGLAMTTFHIPELEVLFSEGTRAVLSDPSKVNRVLELMDQHHVPTMTTELTEVQKELLTNGVAARGKSRFTLHYRNVLSPEAGHRLTELFNGGRFERIDPPTARPMSTWRLIVSDHLGRELQDLHAQWARSRICLLMEAPQGLFWVTPADTVSGSNYQTYTVSAASPESIAPPRGDHYSKLYQEAPNKSWEEMLDIVVANEPELEIVRKHLHQFQQPQHLQVMAPPEIRNKCLLVRYANSLYRAVGINPNGTVLLTTALHQGVAYETTLPLRKLLADGDWSERHV